MDTTRAKERLSIEVKMTDRCNQACSHCVNADGPAPGRDIDAGLVIRRLEEWGKDRENSVCDLKEVRLTGGEPLILFDEVLAIAGCCRKLGIRSGINTNGLLLDPDLVRRMKAGGIEVVKVSLDAMDSAAYARLRGPLPSFRSLLDTIEDLIRNDFKVILRFTLMRENRGYLIACQKLAGEIGIYKLQVKPLIRSGRAAEPEAFLSRGDIDEAFRQLAEAQNGTRIPVEILCWPPVSGTSFSYKNCGSIDKIYISPDLRVSICNFVEGHKESAIGDLAQVPLETILRDRCDGTRTERIDAFTLVKGCPNAPYYERPRI